MIYNEMKYEVEEYFDKYNKNKDILEIKLIDIKEIGDINKIFHGCSSLIYISDLSFLNYKNFQNYESLFQGCSSLEYIPDISDLDMSNIKNIKNLH